MRVKTVQRLFATGKIVKGNHIVSDATIASLHICNWVCSRSKILLLLYDTDSPLSVIKHFPVCSYVDQRNYQ